MPNKVRKGKKATYKVKITNTGKADATWLKLKVTGIGVRLTKKIGPTIKVRK